ncbi:MAG TPA: hypothetical protein VIM10_07285 [Actinopolymorphaceae bacterium]|jgi:hypothetical protein
MAHFTVGGRPIDLTKDAVLRRMSREEPEPLREHLVEISSAAFPPKQVLATVTGWDRQTFTTMEAQRVLTKVGFVSRRVNDPPSEAPVGFVSQANTGAQTRPADQRLTELEAALVVAQQAIAALSGRIAALESRPND